MKLLAAISNTHAVFSVSHHDCNVAPDGTMADGGQPGLQNYAGYTRASRGMKWIELPDVSFDKLYTDYNNGGKNRKYGIHPLSEVRLLEENEIPDVDSFEWKKENFIWGTNGPNGDKPLKFILLADADTPHLKAILANCPHIAGKLSEKIILSILAERKL